MKYYQPLDKLDKPDAPYQNGNEVTGEPGSLPDARGFESTQREIVNAIIAGGDEPAADDNTQLTQAIQKLSGQVIRYQSLYQRLKTVENGIIVAEDEKIIGWAEVAAETTFTIDMTNVTKNAVDDVVTFELYVNMPTPVAIHWPESIIWTDNEAPDLSEAGLYLLTFRYLFKENIWQGSLNALFAAIVR